MSELRGIDAIEEALQRGDHAAVLVATETRLAEFPGDDAAHELRARALLALGRTAEAEQHAADAVRLDPEEIRYRELMAQVLAAGGAHRDAADEFRRLARNDPAQGEWTLAEAEERLDASQPRLGVEAAERAVRLDPRNGSAQLTLSQALARTGDGPGALRAAGAALRLLGGHADAREAVADARWLMNEDAAAFDEYRTLAGELDGDARRRVIDKARALYRQKTGTLGRILAAIGPLWTLAFRNGWISI
jgi:predicted Zn-dependent protease